MEIHKNCINEASFFVSFEPYNLHTPSAQPTPAFESTFKYPSYCLFDFGKFPVKISSPNKFKYESLCNKLHTIVAKNAIITVINIAEKISI